MVVIGICCSSTFSNLTREGSSERPGKVDSCLISFISKAVIPKAHRYPLGSLKYFLLTQSAPRMHRASGPVTMGDFSHSFVVTLISPSVQSAVGIPLSLQKYRWVLPVDGFRVHCAPVSTRALYSCGCDLPGHWIHTA